jgi:hypothetical protein
MGPILREPGVIASCQGATPFAFLNIEQAKEFLNESPRNFVAAEVRGDFL